LKEYLKRRPCPAVRYDDDVVGQYRDIFPLASHNGADIYFYLASFSSRIVSENTGVRRRRFKGRALCHRDSLLQGSTFLERKGAGFSHFSGDKEDISLRNIDYIARPDRHILTEIAAEQAVYVCLHQLISGLAIR